MEDGVAMPEDVLIEILVNLPVKSLMRFKCVSKYWCALIKSPNFVSRHLKRDCNEIVLLKRMLPQSSQGTKGGGGRVVLSFHDPDSLDLLVSPNLPVPQFLDNPVGNVLYDYMGTCNGLVCLGIWETVVLCNPALREFEILPPSPFGIPEHYVRRVLAMGFGFDAITDAYKIVQFASIVNSEKDYHEDFEDAWVRIDMYNSSTNSWRLIDAVVPQVMGDSGFNLFFNGACHWLSYPGRGYSDGILSLDLSIEVFRHFELPDFEDEKFTTLGFLNQCLTLVRFAVRPHDRQFVDIWVMKEYGVKESWTKEFVIGPYTFNYPLLLLKNEWLLMVTIDYQMASCALHGNEIKNLHFDDKDCSTRAAHFKESLVSLKKVILCGKKD